MFPQFEQDSLMEVGSVSALLPTPWVNKASNESGARLTLHRRPGQGVVADD